MHWSHNVHALIFHPAVPKPRGAGPIGAGSRCPDSMGFRGSLDASRYGLAHHAPHEVLTLVSSPPITNTGRHGRREADGKLSLYRSLFYIDSYNVCLPSPVSHSCSPVEPGLQDACTKPPLQPPSKPRPRTSPPARPATPSPGVTGTPFDHRARNELGSASLTAHMSSRQGRAHTGVAHCNAQPLKDCAASLAEISPLSFLRVSLGVTQPYRCWKIFSLMSISTSPMPRP